MMILKNPASRGVLVALIFSSSACESNASKGSSNANRARDSDASSLDAGRTVPLQLQVFDYRYQDMALAGIEACIYPAFKVCQTTDQDGYLVLPLPANSEVAVSLDGTPIDHAKYLYTRTTDDFPLISSPLLVSTEVAKEVADAAGFAIDPAKGTIVGQAYNDVGPVEGVTLTLTPSSGTGPAYYGIDGLPDRTLTATSASGSGLAVFGAVAPGDYTLSFSEKSCTIETNGWKGPSEGVARVPSVAGTRTVVIANCT